MKFKRLLCGFTALTIVSLSLLSGCSASSEESSEASVTESSQGYEESDSSSSSDSEITPAMWKVTSSDGESVIYMMGSIHVGDESVNNMPDYFENIYDVCDSIAVEVDISDEYSLLESSGDETSIDYSALSDYILLLSDLMYTDGTTISDHISEEVYNSAVSILEEYDLYSSLYDYLKPVMWTSLLESVCYTASGLSTDYGVDITIINRAKDDGKDVLEVESAELQYGLMADLSDDLVNMLLESYVADGAIDAQTQALKELYEKWKSGTITAEDVIDEIDENTMTEEEIALYSEYNQVMLADRNVGMADKAEEYMESGDTVLLLVGAAHFYGDDGILQLMQDRGYTVTEVDSNTVIDASELSQAAA